MLHQIRDEIIQRCDDVYLFMYCAHLFRLFFSSQQTRDIEPMLD